MKSRLCDNPNCNVSIEVPDDFKHEFCCGGHMCGCYGYPLNPMFCDSCEIMFFGTQVQPENDALK